MPSVVPITPPWNDIPPSHSFKMSIGCLEIIGEIVEQHVADAAAEDDPERGVEDEIVGVAPGHRRAGLLQQLQQIPIADENPGEVGEAVPAQLEEAEVERDRRQVKVGPGDLAFATSAATDAMMTARASPLRFRAS